jgi:hypothetical protein
MLNKSPKCAALSDKKQKCQKMSLLFRIRDIIVSITRCETIRMLDHRRKTKVAPKDEAGGQTIVVDIKQTRMLRAISRETGIPVEVLILDAIARYAKGKTK